MQLQSDILKIRAIDRDDILEVHELHLLPQIDEYNTLGVPANIEETKVFFELWLAGIEDKTKHVFCLENDAGDFVGIAGMNIGKPHYLKAEIWYKIHPAFWRKGFATEAVRYLLQFGFATLKLHRIEAGCATENIGSVKVLEKTGFQKEGLSRKNLPIRGEWKDNFNFGILIDEWKK